MWELDRKEGWVLKNCCFWIGVLKKTLESPLNFKEIKPVNPKGNQSWIFLRRTDAEAETAILQPPDAKNLLILKDPDTGEDWRQEEKGTTEDEMAGWHHWLDGHEFRWTRRVGDGQGGLVCCDSWGRKESDTTEQLNWTSTPPYHSSRSSAFPPIEIMKFAYTITFMPLLRHCLTFHAFIASGSGSVLHSCPLLLSSRSLILIIHQHQCLLIT